jgi:glycosyltransferase involved in cell wall biosynthesis
MKILQVCPKYHPVIGGAEEYVKNISERLAKKHEVTVFACDPSGKLPREEKINGVLVRRFKSFSPGNAYHISLKMERELKKSEFDIVHGHNYHALPLYFSRNAKRKRFIVNPYYHVYGSTLIRDFLIKLYKQFGKVLFEQADRIITLSEYEKHLLLNDFNINDDKISVIPNGVDLAGFDNLGGISRDSKGILCISRLEEYKGVQHIIKALPLLDEDFHLEIVGKGPYKARLLALIDKLQLNNRVKFYQDLPRQELHKMYARAGVFVLLSQHEAFSIVVSEALAAKTPCIVANTSALSEWIINKNYFGIDYPVDNAKLAELITKVIGTEVGDIKLWDWDDVAREILKVYGDDVR